MVVMPRLRAAVLPADSSMSTASAYFARARVRAAASPACKPGCMETVGEITWTGATKAQEGKVRS